MMRTIGLAVLAAGLITSAAAAQSTDNTKSNLTPAAQPPVQTQPQIIYPAPRSPIGGVPAQFPGPKIIQGVPARLLDPHSFIPVEQTSPNPTPGTWSPPGGVLWSPSPQPTPAYANPDNTHSNLVQRFIDARRGNGFIRGGDGSRYIYPNSADFSGGQFNARFSGDDWRLRLHIGAGIPYVNSYYRPGLFAYPGIGLQYRSYYAPWEDVYRYVTDPYGSNSYLIVGANDAYLAKLQTPAPTPAPREYTALEKATYSLRYGDEAEAIRQFKTYLKQSPDDAGVERLMAMALIDDRKADQAVAVLMHAYTKQPQLARDPIDPRMLAGGEMDHRRRFTAIMDYANRTKTASSLFAASVLAQSEGRYDTAQKLFDRAAAIGLDKKVAEEMKIALANR